MAAPNFSAATDKGLHRGNNEDNYLSIPERGLWLIADGMGGHEAGEVASAIVVETIQKNAEDGRELVEAIQQAHRSVLAAVREGVGAAGMGSTVVALESQGSRYQVAWVGDSRAYLWTPDDGGGTLEQLSTDHSYVQMLLASGAIAAEEAINHPDKNVITQCIGSQDMTEVRVDAVEGQWRAGQWILLCSDGLSDELNDETIAQILCEADSVRTAVDTLLREALRHGGRDNITIQIIESPLPTDSRFTPLLSRLPAITGKRMLDIGLYAGALLCALLLSWWILS
ncbi:serine/threonine-protein phosphatase [Proteobacteria bacterium 005FR1]|nr:serine/threonine-protein phosphatase [Proteobacteria bacterium 005FR1]